MAPRLMSLRHAVAEIKDACDGKATRGKRSPFFFLVGAGISHPPVPLSAQIVEHCQRRAVERGHVDDLKNASAMGRYSHWFERSYPQPEQRSDYLRSLIEGQAISQANFRLAHLLLGEDGHRAVTDLVVTPNFDDFLSRALRIFGKQHVVCDHPATTTRLAAAEHGELQILHVHGTYSFYDCKNLGGEITSAAIRSEDSVGSMPAFLDHVLMARSPIVVGYGGWEEDVLMQALKRRLAGAGLPNNIYWFCRTRGQVSFLPSWLRDHGGVRFAVPDPPPVQRAPSSGASLSPRGDQGEQTDSGTVPLETASGEATLDAHTVFDEFNRTFKFPAPRITRDPVAFFAAQLRATLPTEDLRGGKDDIYGLKDVIERLEAPSSSLARLETSSAAVDPLEAVREAVRRSDYLGALRSSATLDVTSLQRTAKEELLMLAGAIADGLDNNSPEEIAAYDLGLQIGATIDSPSASTHEEICRLFTNRGFVNVELQQFAAAESDYGAAIERLVNSTDIALQRELSRALFGRAYARDHSGNTAEGIEDYDVLIDRFMNTTDSGLRGDVLRAHVNKASSLRTLGKVDEALQTCEAAMKLFPADVSPQITATRARAMTLFATMLEEIGRTDEAMAYYDRIVDEFGDAPGADTAFEVIRARFRKAFELAKRGDRTNALIAYDDVIRRTKASPSPEVQVYAARSMFNRAVQLRKAGRIPEARRAFEEVRVRFGDSSDPSLAEPAARSLISLADIARENGDAADALTIYDELLGQFGTTKDEGVETRVLDALDQKADTLDDIKRHRESVLVLDDLIARLTPSERSDRAERLSDALNMRGFGRLLLAKQDIGASRAQDANASLRAAEADLVRSLELDESAITLGNLAYVRFLLDERSLAAEHLRRAFELDGEDLRAAELKDMEMYPIEADAEFRRLVDELPAKQDDDADPSPDARGDT